MRAHGIMIPLPYQGHINPFVHLAIKLASKGITITFINTQRAHNLISTSHSCNDDIFYQARTAGLDIRYTTISDGLPLDFDRDANLVEYWENLMNHFPSLALDFVGKIIESSDLSLPSFLISDTFGAWPVPVAEKYNMVTVFFWTMPAAVFSIDYHRSLLVENGHYPPKGNDEHVIRYIPGIESISTKDLMSHLQEADETILHKFVFRAFDVVDKADFMLHNTVQELEPHTLSALNEIQPTYAIGPANSYSRVRVPKSMLSETDCAKWLDSKLPCSVLYVSFGSFMHTSEKVIQDIAQGLLLSEVHFIWAIRPKIVSSIEESTALLPDGFESAIGDRGLIVPWCNQLDVLSNPAVGGFLTHCGWNSVIESMSCGVPMICYPSVYDQPTNRKLVVEDWKIGINLYDRESIKGEEVAEKIKRVMNGDASNGIRCNVKKFSSILHNGLEKNGSSERNLDQFFKDLEDKIQAKKDGAGN